MTRKILGIGLVVAGILLVSEANAERYRYRNYRTNNYGNARTTVYSRPNIFGGRTYYGGRYPVQGRSNLFNGQTYSNGLKSKSNIFNGRDYRFR